MEPRSSSSQEALSNLQRKVLKNTFVNNSNDLRLRDETVSRPSFSDWLPQSKSRVDSRPVETSGLSKVLGTQGVSFSQSIDKLFQTTKDFDLSHVQTAQEDLAARLQETLLKAEAGSVILLPPKRISVSTLRICNPMTIKGSPGTTLEVTNGSIVVDFSSPCKESLLGHPSDRVEICELSLVFNADRRCLDSKAPVALFIVDTPNSFLEVRDCDIKSVSGEAHNVSIDSSGPYMIQDVCLWVNGFSSRKEGASERGFCGVFMTSCNVTGFYEFAKGGSNCKLHIEKCHISDCSCNALTLLNPKELIVNQSVVERCQGSSIDVRLKTEAGSRVQSRSGSLTTTQEASARTISITGNDIRSNGAYGITIWSEHQAAVPICISISRNKVSSCRKEGVAVRHLTLSELSILSNDFSSNQGTGCWLQKVYKLYNESAINVSLNRAFDSHSGYGLYLYDSAGVLDGNECFRNSLGGVMIVGSTSKDVMSQDLTITRGAIYTNGENGITVLDFARGTVRIEHCRVFENFHNGLYFLQSQESTASVAPKADQVLPQTNKGEIHVTNCEVARNRQYGITLSMIKCFITETSILDNVAGAVSLDERSKPLLKFTSASEQVRGLVQGTIGGDWGSLYPEKRGLCGRSSCVLF